MKKQTEAQARLMKFAVTGAMATLCTISLLACSKVTFAPTEPQTALGAINNSAGGAIGTATPTPTPSATPAATATPLAATPTPVPTATPITEVHYPTVGSDVAAVAFEDNFPKAGDADFNDFLTNFRMTEKVNSQNQITEIILDFYPRAVGASYDHSFMVVLNGEKDQPSNIMLKTVPMFNGGADVTLTHIATDGTVLDTKPNIDPNHDVVIFPSTHALFQAKVTKTVVNTFATKSYTPALQMARLQIKLKDPKSNPLGDRTTADGSKLRMVLHVKDTNQDIDTIDADPVNLDSNGYPFGFIIPSNWRWPTEGTSIMSVYPNFALYQIFLLERAAHPDADVAPEVENWFNFLLESPTLYPSVPLSPLLPTNAL